MSTTEPDALHPTPLLDVSDLSVRYGGKGAVRVVDRLSFEIAAGEAVGVLGESGSGKTTLALAITGLLPVGGEITGGAVFFHGRALPTLDEAELRRIRGAEIGCVFQQPSLALHPMLRARDQVAEVLRAHRGGGLARWRAEADAGLTEVGLDDLGDAFPHQLSGGQRQRVVIAQALACGPSLVLADEPTAALDPTVRNDILDLLRRLVRNSQTALLLISHDPQVLERITDRLVVMENGRLVEAGSTSDVLAEPSHAYTQTLLASLPPWPGESRPPSQSLTPIPSPSHAPRPPRERGASACPSPDGGAVVGHLAQDGIDSLVSRGLGVGAPLPGRLWRVGGRGDGGEGPLLQAHNLTRTYPPRGRRGREVVALDGVDLDIESGSILALVGESGSGKSTLARCLAALEEPTSGEVRLDGEKPRDDRQHQAVWRRSVQLVFQDPVTAVNPRFDVAAAIDEPLHLAKSGDEGWRQSRVRELMDEVGLAAIFSRRSPLELSGGQVQRVVIARALAAEPRVLILDEGLTALDLSLRARIVDLLLDLRRRHGLTYVLIVHDLRLAAHFADEIAVLDAGRIVERRIPAELLNDPHHETSRALVEAARFGGDTA